MNHFWHKWWAIVVTLTLFFVLLLGGGLYALAYEGKIYPGIRVGSFPLGGLTPGQAEDTLAAALSQLRDNGLLFVYGDRRVSVPMVSQTTADPDLSYEIINYDPPAVIREAYAVGRDKNFWRNWQERLSGLLGEKELSAPYIWREDKAMEILQSNFGSLESPGTNATLEIKGKEVIILSEKEGSSFNYAKALRQAQTQLDSLLFAPITLELKRDFPQVTRLDALPFLPQIEELARQEGDIQVCKDLACQGSAGGKTWEIERQKINSLLELIKTSDGKVAVGFNKEKFAALLEPIAGEINSTPQEPKFALENGRVVEFAGSEEGRNLNLEKTRASWEEDLIAKHSKELSLAVEVTPAKGTIAELNDLGIQKILGVGASNFAGSPSNRRHNIKVGADSLDGILIAPGEEFSLLKALGAIDAKAGYLPELVIKGNKTVPEYGGGLCQIGTTTFRATLASGLPVTARRNHSYAVTYYNDALGRPGTDATIYNPAPDYRFRNDTANYILIQTRIEGDNLYFEFWGTPDGRKAEQSETRVWDKISPGPTKFIETLELKPGEKKCTERPHAGIKAAFDYKIKYSDGREEATTFSSTYRPWQEVCLIGVEKLSEETASPESAEIPTDPSLNTTGVQ